MKKEKCPYCGAEEKDNNLAYRQFTCWTCIPKQGEIDQSKICLRNQCEQLQAELSREREIKEKRAGMI